MSRDARWQIGDYKFEPLTGALERGDGTQTLQPLTARLLTALAERPGQLVTREEVRAALWPSGETVAFDEGIDTAVRRLRRALGDSAAAPRYIETLPRRGFRLLCSVSCGAHDAPPSASPATPSWRPWHTSRRGAGLAAVAVLLAVVSAVWWRPSGARPDGSDVPRLAVLPFSAGSPRAAALAVALREELIAHLGQLSPTRLEVLGRASSDALAVAPARDIGQTHLVEGHVVADAESVQMDVRVLSPQGVVTWSRRLTQPASRVADIRAALVTTVGRRLVGELLAGEVAAMARVATPDPVAYDAYLEGIAALSRGTDAAFSEATAAFERATAVDPKYGLAYARLAEVALVQHDYGLISREQLNARAGGAVVNALALAPESGIVHAVGGGVQHANRKWPEARESLQRAVAASPSDAAVRRRYAWLLLDLEQPREALAVLDEAAHFDPLSAEVHAARAFVLFELSDHGAARQAFEKAAHLDPAYPFAAYGLGVVAEARHDTQAAIRAFERAHDLGGGAPKYASALGVAYARAGRQEQARALLHELQLLAARRYVAPKFVRALTGALGTGTRPDETASSSTEARGGAMLTTARRGSPLQTP